jgi:hypothetical protein
MARRSLDEIHHLGNMRGGIACAGLILRSINDPVPFLSF